MSELTLFSSDTFFSIRELICCYGHSQPSIIAMLSVTTATYWVNKANKKNKMLRVSRKQKFPFCFLFPGSRQTTWAFADRLLGAATLSQHCYIFVCFFSFWIVHGASLSYLHLPGTSQFLFVHSCCSLHCRRCCCRHCCRCNTAYFKRLNPARRRFDVRGSHDVSL